MWELCIYDTGTAVLTDDRGEVVWSSDDDDEFAAEFEDVLTWEDGDEIAAWLEASGHLPEEVELEIVESDDAGELIESDEDDEDDDDES